MSAFVLNLMLALAPAQGVPREPMEILSSFGADLRKGLRPNVDRAAYQKAAVQQFDKEIDRAVIRDPKLVWEYFNEYVSRLYEAERSFNAKDQKPERALWITACRGALLKAASLARAPDTVPTTVELFNTCMDAAARVRSRLTGEGVDDISAAAFESINNIFRGQVRRCAPSKGDPKATYLQQVSQVELRFGKTNQLPERMLRDIAKACMDKDVTAKR